MKKIKSIMLFAVAVALTALSDCDRKDPQPKTELEKLPPATQEGKYTFGCLVNGKAFVTKTSLDVAAVYQFDRLTIRGSLETSEFSRAIVMSVLDANLNAIEYRLNDSFLRYAEIRDSDTIVLCDYITNGSDGNNGRLVITHVDREKFIVSGLFEFVVAAPNCTTYVVTDGRFDLKFIP